MALLNQAGHFKCVVVAPEYQDGLPVWIGESKTGTEYVGIPLEVSEGPCAGQQITWYGYLSEAAFNSTIERLAEVFSFDGDLGPLINGQMSLVGLPCSIETEMETYDGKTRCKVKWLNSPNGGGRGVTPCEAGKAKALISRMGSRGKAVAAAKLKELNREPLAVAPQSQGTGSDLPF